MTPQVTVVNIHHIEPSDAVADALAQCWADVANSGGAVGFPFIPVDLETAHEAVRRLADELDSGHRFVVGALDGDELVGWVTVRLNHSPLAAHWGKLEHLQSHPTRRAEGIGTALLSHAGEHAASLPLEQLVLAARGGEGLEPYYERHGWVEIGRHEGALRFADGDDRDEVIMRLRLPAQPS